MHRGFRRMQKQFDESVSKSLVGKFFKLEARKTSCTQELLAATATFLTMAYIITVNATILSDSGGTCHVSDHTTEQTDAKIEYENCVGKLKSDLIVATSLSSMIGSIAMGLLANLPFGLAPGMGANVYVAYDLVGFHGSGSIPYKTAMAIVLVEGCAFLAISVLGLRAKLARLIPGSVRLACAAGIGLFIAFVGLQSSQGLGLIGPDPSTLVTLTACKRSNPLTGQCLGGKMQSPTFWLGFSGFVIMCFGLMKNIKGSMIYGMLFVMLVSWIRGTSVTFFPHTPLGDSRYEYFKKVVDFHWIKSTLFAISFENFNRSQVWIALATLLYVDVLSTTGTLYTMARMIIEPPLANANDEVGQTISTEGEKGSSHYEGEYAAYMVDAGSTIVGSTLGVSPVVAYVESTAGIREGGRTGLTAVIVGLYFGLSLLFTPLLASVPSWAVGPSLVMVGVLMMRAVREIDWDNVREGATAFVTMALMPLSYSISNGIVGGIGIYVVLGLMERLVGWIRWGLEMRRVVVSEQNQVSHAAAAAANVEEVF